MGTLKKQLIQLIFDTQHTLHSPKKQKNKAL